MEFRKMIFDGINYNVLTDDELEEVKHMAYLDYVTNKCLNDVENETIPSEVFEQRFKERYGL